MKNRKEYDNALAAEYALGTLRGLARLRFEQRLHADPILAAEVGRWQDLLIQLDNDLEPQIPPEHIWRKIQLRLGPEKQRSGRRYYALLGWAVAAGFAAILLLPQPGLAPLITPVAVLASAQPADGQWIVGLDKTNHQLTLSALHAPAVSPDHSLELWLIPAGGVPNSLGLINVTQLNQVNLAQHQLLQGASLAITLEPKGGSPTGQPTGKLLYSGILAI